VRVRILPSDLGAGGDREFLSAFVVNGTLAVDAGPLALSGTCEEQGRIDRVILTHSHADHVGSLPVFVENSADSRRGPLSVCGGADTLVSLREDVFNDRVWPDYVRLAAAEEERLRFVALEPEVPVEVNGLRITPVAVSHTVPAFGYVVENESGAVVFGGDSGPTDRIWEVARRGRKLRAAFLEATFPDGEEDLARRTGHLTPRLLAGEAAKLPTRTAVIVVHMRPRFRERILEELQRGGPGGAGIGKGGTEYRF
jgi:ribonuclease BN (tRNA processing enzyme)